MALPGESAAGQSWCVRGGELVWGQDCDNQRRAGRLFRSYRAGVSRSTCEGGLRALINVEEIVKWAIGVVELFGYPGIVLLLILENLFPPIPSEAILPLTGYLASEGRMSFAGAVAAATTGSVTGALILYAIGNRLGEARVRRLFQEGGRVFYLDERDYDRARSWFDRNRELAVIVSRVAPTGRSFISIPAGIAGMPILRFAVCTAIGSGLFNTALVTLGWFLAAHWQEVEPIFTRLRWVFVALVAVLVFWFLQRRARERG
jgi:membrane protein DedA with SNARE-associated domain